MKTLFALTPVILLAVSPAGAGQARPGAPAVVTRYCSGCHGVSGMSDLPYIPRLAGLSPTYIERKLSGFRAAAPAPADEPFRRIGKDSGITRNASAHMVGVAHAISEQDRKAAAQWFAAQAPAPGRSGKPKLIEEGKTLFANGLESQGLTACQACHGPKAEGTAIAPRLAGQNAAYVLGQLSLFRTSSHNSSPEMTAVARHVEGDQARALAVYLQSR